MSLYKIFSKTYQKAALEMCRECQPFINKGSKILDLGCGSGIVSKVIQDYFQADLIGVDIKDNRTTDIPFKLIDGKTLPFPDNEFDLVFINYVLHHTPNPAVLLKEARRVSNKEIIVYEDLAEDFLSKIFCQIHGFTFNTIYCSSEKTSFHSKEEWEEIFDSLKLKVIFEKKVIPAGPIRWIYPVKRMMFVLEKI